MFRSTLAEPYPVEACILWSNLIQVNYKHRIGLQLSTIPERVILSVMYLSCHTYVSLAVSTHCVLMTYPPRITT